MSKDAWFIEYERLEAEYPDKEAHVLGEMAFDAMRDRADMHGDFLRDQAKEDPCYPSLSIDGQDEKEGAE
jgi:hypothetical protein|tara:strand:- start:353 stop:562 length:210 start_codon:yes stop_codon:yes gene_type:complete